MKCFHKWHPDSTDLFGLQLRRRHVLFGKLWRTFFLLRVFCACAKRFQERICIFPVFRTWAPHPKVALASSGTKASATLWKNLNWKSHVCLLLFFMNERIWNFWETICISRMPYYLWWFPEQIRYSRNSRHVCIYPPPPPLPNANMWTNVKVWHQS